MSIKIAKLRIIETVFVVALLVLIIGVRAYKLDADPPMHLSGSTDVYTDPPNLTLYAKQKIVIGEFTPSGDNRFVLFLKSSITLLGLFIFKYFGTGLFYSNLIGLFYSFGALFLFFLIVRKTAGPLAAILYLLIIFLNYLQIFYGRLPFQEHAMTFWLFLSMTLLLYYKDKIIINILAGISLGVGIFFGKILGIAFLFPALCYFSYSYFIEKDRKQKSAFIYYISGFSLSAIFWIFYAYIPMKMQVSSYIGEHVYSNQGFPDGLSSIGNFALKYITFGGKSLLVQWMFIEIHFTGFLICMILMFLIFKNKAGSKWKSYNSGHIFIVSLIVGFFLFLMIWNYRPMRYQLILLYPLCASMAIIFSMLLRKVKILTVESITFNSFYILLPIYGALFFHSYAFYATIKNGHYTALNSYFLIWVGALSLSLLVYLILKLYNQKIIPRIPYFGQAVVVFILVSMVYLNWNQYNLWKDHATFTTLDNSRDLNMILNRDAVITGPYSSTLTIETELKTVIHMFGVTNPDPDFFKNLPITHLLIDNSNEKRAFQDYPEMMKASTHILSYHIANKKVRLYRISGNTGNPIADSYQPSKFEQLVEEYNNVNSKINNQLAIDFLKEHPDNITCYTFLAEVAERDNMFDLAESMFKKAVEFSPTSYNITGRLAKFYHDRFNQTKLSEYKEKSLHYYDMAIWVAPTKSLLRSARQTLIKTK